MMDEIDYFNLTLFSRNYDMKYENAKQPLYFKLESNRKLMLTVENLLTLF
jgi:hypothetical protein